MSAKPHSTSYYCCSVFGTSFKPHFPKMHRTLHTAVHQVQTGNATQYTEFLELFFCDLKMLRSINISSAHRKPGAQVREMTWSIHSVSDKATHWSTSWQATGSSDIPEVIRPTFPSSQNLTNHLILSGSV